MLKMNYDITKYLRSIFVNNQINNQKITKDILVFQLLVKLSRETDKLTKLADDIDAHAVSPQAKSALNIIATQVQTLLTSINKSLDPLYKLYDLDPGMKKIGQPLQNNVIENTVFNDVLMDDSYDEDSLWSEFKN